MLFNGIGSQFQLPPIKLIVLLGNQIYAYVRQPRRKRILHEKVLPQGILAQEVYEPENPKVY